MRESKRLKRKATRRSAKERKPKTKRRMVTNVDAAATMERTNTKPRWKDPRQESQMMRMMSSKFIQVSQNDQ